jgi:cytochrome c-type biogenesis protein CcsB
VNEAIYPDRARLAWENWYFDNDQMTRTWLVYLLAIIPLLLAVVYRWRWALWAGLLVFAIAGGLQTFAVGLRWWISGRWPNTNMFEAVTTASWFAVVLAFLLEILWLRRTSFRGLLPLGAAATAMVALMMANFLPVYLNPNISNMMPVLHDVWLYIHTNVVIFSYAIIFMASVSAMLYLAYRLLGGKAVYARAGGAGALVITGPDGHTLADLDDSDPVDEKARARRRDKLGEIFDGTTMILMELSFVMLFSGIVMGAIWADHSWGRPWGWDPKEVFALNTFIIFALLVHVRLKVRDKGLWTAILAVVGAGVMLFNWIVINFVITGLHSYA